MKKFPAKIFIIIVAILFLAALLLPRNFLGGGREVIFKVEAGEGSRDIAINLEKEKLIYWGPIFRIYVYFSGSSKKLQAGNYRFLDSMNIPAIASQMTKGDILLTTVTIPEGFDAGQIYQKLEGISDVRISELEKFQGYLFPDTYELPFGIKEEDVVKIMIANFNEKVTSELREEIEKQKKELNDIVIMASILEREVITKEEKELASGILWKRMKIGMPLQVDSATLTYKERGLPENPICNPGLESIMAAVYPKDSPYFYYLSKPDGVTIFSKTLEEHNIAKAKYLK